MFYIIYKENRIIIFSSSMRQKCQTVLGEEYTSLIVPTDFPSNSTTTSPGWNPARSAGDLGVTFANDNIRHIKPLPFKYYNEYLLLNIYFCSTFQNCFASLISMTCHVKVLIFSFIFTSARLRLSIQS